MAVTSFFWNISGRRATAASAAGNPIESSMRKALVVGESGFKISGSVKSSGLEVLIGGGGMEDGGMVASIPTVNHGCVR